MTSTAVTVEDDGPMLRASVPLSGCGAEFALSMFTDPVQLARWWRGELHTELVVGGQYAVDFPGLGQTMTGTLVSYEPAKYLEFTWGWEHDPGSPRRTVAVHVDDAQAEALTIEHGPHGDDAAEVRARADHRAGWEHFLPKLAAALAEPR